MKTTFKLYLCEGGNATAEWGTERLSPDDTRDALNQLASILNISYDDLKSRALGSSRLTLLGKRETSGDLDLVIENSRYPEFHEKMMKAVQQRGVYNSGTKIGSYALELKSGKKVQIDLMFADSTEFAKFMYYSAEGEDSKYPGAVRNIMLMTLATHVLRDGDFVIRDEERQIIARASRSLKLNVGLERLFKVAKKRKDGEGRVKSLEKVSPDELEKELKDIAPHKIGTFKKDADIVNSPDKIAQYFFGKGISGDDIKTAEQVSKLINEKFSGEKLARIKENIKKQLEQSDLPVPKEL